MTRAGRRQAPAAPATDPGRGADLRRVYPRHALVFTGTVFGCIAATHAQSTDDPLAAYAHTASSTTVRARAWNGTSWDSETPAGTLGAGLCQLDLSRGPSGHADALLTLSEARVLRLHRREAGVWDAGTQLSADTGTAQAPVAAVAHERSSGSLLMVYRSGSGATVRYRTHDAGVLSAETSLAVGLPAAPEEILLVERPGSDEIALFTRAGSTLSSVIWSGSGFGAASTLTTSAGTVGRACDAAYETSSGDVLAVWSEGTSIRYAARVGAWGSPGTVATPGGTIHALRLVANPATASNTALLCYETSSGVVAARPWTGTAWGGSQTLDTQGGGGVGPRVDAAWHSDGSAAVVAWTRSNATLVRSRSWDGAAWSVERTGPTLTTAPQRIRLAPGRSSSQVLAACLLRPSSYSIDDYLVYGDSAATIGSTVIHGPYGANVSGVNLPTAPSSSHGSSNQTYGNNQTVTIAPGSYGDYKFGNHCVINLSAGTYRFKTFDMQGNTITMNFNTAAGDIVFILANGNLQPGNNFTLTNTGGGLSTVHIVNGNFQTGNDPTIYRADIRVYNGNIQVGTGLTAYGTLWASSNVELQSGHVYAYSASSGTSGPLVAFPFADGIAGAAATLSSDARGGPSWESFDVGAAASGLLRITNWQEVAP